MGLWMQAASTGEWVGGGHLGSVGEIVGGQGYRWYPQGDGGQAVSVGAMGGQGVSATGCWSQGESGRIGGLVRSAGGNRSSF